VVLTTALQRFCEKIVLNILPVTSIVGTTEPTKNTKMFLTGFPTASLWRGEIPEFVG
jgi:hypothetical protein